MIDADELIADMRHEYNTCPSAPQFGVLVCEYGVSLTQIESAPTAVVNCIDCRLCSERGGHANCNGYLICTMLNRVVDEDTYCAWGERK